MPCFSSDVLSSFCVVLLPVFKPEVVAEGEREKSVCCIRIPAHPTSYVSSVNFCPLFQVVYKLLSFMVWDASFRDVVLSCTGALEGEGRVRESGDKVGVKWPLFSFA